MSEVDIYKEIIDFVNATGCYAYRNSVGGRGWHRFGEKGQADISGVIFRTGQRLEIEVKSKTGKLSEDQETFLYNIKCRGGVVLVVSSLDEVVTAFKEMGLCRN